MGGGRDGGRGGGEGEGEGEHISRIMVGVHQLFNADREGNLCLLYAVRDNLEAINPICAFCRLLEIV